ncbi:MAG: class I SAM-dependent methyltransferase, partial [Acidobacteriota bacterium]|nr:class I SAM-dependent methyltransferase [Acidobacteriota bacterium]
AFSYGMDRRWKRTALKLAQLAPDALILDLACGTGDFSRMLRDGSQAIACDLTESMLHIARTQGVRKVICGDAMRLPFKDRCFDAVLIGYGMRNFPDLPSSIIETRRVIKAGGRLVTLDFFLPENAWQRRLFLTYLYLQGAFWGALLHRNPRIYTYIPASLRTFVSRQQFSEILTRAGFRDVQSRSYLRGGIAVHSARLLPTPRGSLA